MHRTSRQTASRHWARILDCDPETVFSPGTAVTEWDDVDVELLCWDGGTLVGAPADLVEPLRKHVGDVQFDLDRAGARDLVASVTAVDQVLGPQFVGYCDESTFEPVDDSAREIEPDRLEPLRDACPSDEWDRSALSLDAEVPTFAVVADGRPVAAAQYGAIDDVAQFSVASHPDYRGEGNATAATSAAAKHALDRGFVAEYRTVERWDSSVALAERLGFERIARSLLVRPTRTAADTAGAD